MNTRTTNFCKHGHDLTDNVYTAPATGYTQCKTCMLNNRAEVRRLKERSFPKDAPVIKEYRKKYTLTEDQQQYIISYYNGRNGNLFAQRFNVSIHCIDAFKRKSGLIRVKTDKAKVLKVENDFFDVDNELNWVA